MAGDERPEERLKDVRVPAVASQAARNGRPERRRGPPRLGSTLVEMALLLPMFLILLFGIMDFGIYMFLQVSINHAVRSGMRLATSNTYTRAQIIQEVVNDCVGCNLSTANVTITTGGNCPYLLANNANATACSAKNEAASCEPNAAWTNAGKMDWAAVNYCAPWVQIQATMDHTLFLQGFYGNGFNSLQVQSIEVATVTTWAGGDTTSY